MIRRNRKYSVTHRFENIVYSPCETSQLEPNLRELLVKYQQGLDISDHIILPASKATAEQQFTNRIAKVDPLTEIPAYIKSEQKKADAMVETDKKRAKSKQATSTTVETPENSQSEV